ncbi:MAG TPA: hypothetical protein VFE62_27220, partial [Gemmataceae bacterium]|nr:hypothetical protein [Gemmataceae bacterium]
MSLPNWFRLLALRFFSRPRTRPIIRRSQAHRPNLEQLEDRLAPAAFVPGDLAVVVAAASVSNTTASIVELNPNVTQAAVQTISVSGSGPDAIRISGSGTSTAYPSLTKDGSLLTFTGANSTDTTTFVTNLNPRAVVTFDAGGNFNKATTYTGLSGKQTRSATSLNNSTWFIGDENGYYTNGATSPNPSGNVRSLKVFGGTVYSFTASTTAPYVSTVSAASGGIVTGLPGLANGTANGQDFYLISSGDNGSTFDVLYILTASSNTAGVISKFSLVNGSWTGNGTYSTNFGGFGMVAADNGNGALLYVTTGAGALTTNSVMRLADTAGYNSTISITTANNVAIYTVPGTAVIKGIAFTPDDGMGSIGGMGGTTNYTAASPATAIASAPTFTDLSNFKGGSLTISYSSGGTSGDIIGINNVGDNDDEIGISDATVNYGGLSMGTLDSTLDGRNGNALKIHFNGVGPAISFRNVLADAVLALMQQITFASSSVGDRVIQFTITQNDGKSTSATQTVHVTSGMVTPTVNLSVSASAGSEAGTTAITVTATADGAVTGDQTVDLAISGAGVTSDDYTLTGRTITILSG